MSRNFAQYGLGDVVASGELTNLYGQHAMFEDRNLNSTERVKPLKTGIPVKAIFVKNGDASAITPRLAVKWDSGTDEIGTTVVPAGDGDRPCGFASPYMPSAGAAAGEGFFIIVDGPAEAISDGGSTLAVTDIVVTAASGKVNKQTAAPADATAAVVQVNSVCGRPMESVAATDGATFRILVKCPAP